jgi:hypothetical protein
MSELMEKEERIPKRMKRMKFRRCFVVLREVAWFQDGSLFLRLWEVWKVVS